MASKSPSGTEYVNAQLEEIKEQIDKYAKKISELTPGARLGMVWMGNFSGANGAVSVFITGDGYEQYYDSSTGRNKKGWKYTLHVSGGFNGGGGWSRSVDTGIKDMVKPKSTVTATFTPSWFDYSPDVPCSASLSKNGTLTLTIGSGPSGQFNTSASWRRS